MTPIPPNIIIQSTYHRFLSQKPCTDIRSTDLLPVLPGMDMIHGERRLNSMSHDSNNTENEPSAPLSMQSGRVLRHALWSEMWHIMAAVLYASVNIKWCQYLLKLNYAFTGSDAQRSSYAAQQTRLLNAVQQTWQQFYMPPGRVYSVGINYITCCSITSLTRL